MDYFLTLAVVGIAALGMAWMPAISSRIRISYALIYVILGVLLYSVFDRFPNPDPFEHPVATVHFTEIVVIVALMGTGLKIDDPFTLTKWALPLRMVTISLVACIALFSVIAVFGLGLDWPSAILLAAVLTPTDPVLASDVQVGPPHEASPGNVKFTLTAEGGMNDGTAFPFVWLAIYLAWIANGRDASLTDWLLWAVVYKITVGIVCGLLLGKALAYLIFSLPEKYRVIRINDGFAALAITLLVYGLTELANGYGFMAVFVCALTLRNAEMHHKLHRKLHAFTDQIERILVAIGLLLFGGALVSGLLDYLTWPMALAGIAFLCIVRPVTNWLSLWRTKIGSREKWAINFFGIRGMGSLFYISFALQQAEFKYARQVWSIVAFIVLLSIILHGLTAGTVMNRLEKAMEAEESTSSG